MTITTEQIKRLLGDPAEKPMLKLSKDQQKIVDFMRQKPEQVTGRQICDATGFDPKNINKRMNFLEARHIVESIRVPRDRDLYRAIAKKMSVFYQLNPKHK